MSRDLQKVGRNVSLTLGFAINMLVLAAAGLVMIPALIGSVGPRDWAAIAIAQAIGGFCGVVTGFGWGLSGPAYVARQGSAVRRIRYFESLRGRGLVGSLALPVGVLLLAAVLGGFRLVPSVALLVTAAVAFSPAWFYVGIAKPWTMIFVDTAPRALSTVLAVVLLQAGVTAVLALLVQLVGIALGVVTASIIIGRSPRSETRAGSVLRVLREQAHGMIAAGTSAAFAALPVVLVGVVAPSAVAVYAVFDKVQRQFASAISPVVQVSQGVVARADHGDRRRAVVLVSGTVLALALVGLAAFLWVGPWFLHVLVARTLDFSPLEVAVLGVALALILIEQTVGHAVLATAGRMRALATATLIGAAVGLVLVILGARIGGAVTALIGFETGLALAIVLEVVLNRREREGRGRHALANSVNGVPAA